MNKIAIQSQEKLFSFFQRVSNGFLIVKSFKQFPRYFQDLKELISQYINSQYILQYLNWWHRLRIQRISIVFYCTACVVFHDREFIFMFLSQGNSFIFWIEWFIFLILLQSDLLVNVEKIFSFIEVNQIPQKLETKKLKNGRISFKDLDFKYQIGDRFILKNVSIEIPNASRIGIIGESGCGKSTCKLNIFNLLSCKSLGRYFKTNQWVHFD
jgi:ABC-type multidrug transport system fused ATPase/permease subunit